MVAPFVLGLLIACAGQQADGGGSHAAAAALGTLCIGNGAVQACARPSDDGGGGRSFVLKLQRSASSSAQATTILQSPGIVAEYELQAWTGATVVSAEALELTATHASTSSAAKITALIELTPDGYVNATVFAAFNVTALRSSGSPSPAPPAPAACRADAVGNTGLHNLEMQFDFNADSNGANRLTVAAAAAAAAAGTTPFRWLPNLHRAQCKPTPCHSDHDKVYPSDPNSNTNDHFFRSPAVIGAASGLAFALVPDLDVIGDQQRAGFRSLPHSLDLHAANDTVMSAWVGLASSSIEPHIYSVRDNKTTLFALPGENRNPLFSTTVMIDFYSRRNDIVGQATTYLWQRYGRRYLADIRPQVLPWEGYAFDYAYDKVMMAPYRDGSYASALAVCKVANNRSKSSANAQHHQHHCGFNNVGRHGSNYHAWENDIVLSFGLLYWGAQRPAFKKPVARVANDTSPVVQMTLAQLGNNMVRQQLSAPIVGAGAFPSVYNYAAAGGTGEWEATIPFAEPPSVLGENGGVKLDQAAMGLTRFWETNLIRHLEPSLEPELVATINAKVQKYALFLESVMLPNGAIPTYFNQTSLEIDFCGAREEEGGCISATSAIGGAVLARAAKTNASLTAAATKAGNFVAKYILPTMQFYDFETFFSCARKNANWTDTISKIKAQNSLSIGWSADHMLAMYELTSDTIWLERGELVVNVFSLLQQVWSQPRMEQCRGYFFGGHACQNTDGEWNDREHRAVPTLSDYYVATGKLEYLERAVAATRAGFGLMHMEPDHAHNITMNIESAGVPWPYIGMSPENVLHGGFEFNGFSGFNWGSGGASTAAAYVRNLFGDVYVDVGASIGAKGSQRGGDSVAVLGTAIGINGVFATLHRQNDGTKSSLMTYNVSITNALAAYGIVDRAPLLVKFGRAQHVPQQGAAVVVNGRSLGNRTAEQLVHGIIVTL